MERRRFLSFAALGLFVPVAGCLEEDIDIRILSVRAEPVPATVGDTVEVIVDLVNLGEHDGTRTVTQYIDDDEWDDEDVTVSGSPDDDAPGRQVPFEIDTSGFEAGTYELRAEIEDDEASEMLRLNS